MNITRDEQALLAEHLDHYLNGNGFDEVDDLDGKTEPELDAVLARLTTGE